MIFTDKGINELDQFKILDDLPALFCRFRKDGTIFFVNNAYSKFFHSKKENIYGTKFFIDTTELEKSESIISSISNFKEQYSLRLENGSVIWIEWTINKIVNNSSDNFEYLAVGIDISKHKLVEEQLVKISTAVEQSKSTVIITDTKGIIEYVNPRFTEVTGYTPEEVMGKSTQILKSGKVDKETYKQLWETISSGRDWQGELLNKKKNGDLFWELVSISPVKNSENQITHY